MRSADLSSIKMIERLVGFDTTSRLSNMALIEWVQAYLAEHGIDSRLTFDDDRKKANLFATLGPADRPGLVLSGHTDVVPVDGQPWDTDPFVLTERDGRLYGRGTSDMKSFLAVVLTLVPEFVRRGLETPIHLALSYDEEVGCIGVRRLLADLTAAGIKPQGCIVGEPTEMKVITGHKGKLSVRCRVRGHECHSALAPQGVNAVEAAAETVAFLKRMARERRRDGPFNRLFDPAYTTIHTGVIHGGTALNIVPRDCAFDFEFRYIPGDDPQALLGQVKQFCATELAPEMQAVAPDTGFHFDAIGGFSGLDIEDDSEIATFAKSLSGANDTGKVSFGTEAGLFQHAGIPTVICGPGSIEQAHRPNEFVALEQIALCERFMRRLMDRVCAS
jgi:acetylornithine deacetylase